MYKRGDIYYIHKGDARTYGSEQEAGRPAIIVSNDTANEHSPVVEIVYLTTQPKTDLPTHVTIKSAPQKSIALCEQITSVYVDRIGDYVGTLTDKEMDLVDECLMVSLGLDGFYYEDKSVDDSEARIKDAEAKASRLQQELDRYKTMATPSEVLGSKLAKAEIERDTYKSLYDDLLAKVMSR